jgi:hypothetical protein
MPGILSVRLKVIAGYKRKTQNENNYPEKMKTTFFRLLHGTADCRLAREGTPQFTFHLVPGEGVAIGGYFKI